MNEDRFSRDDVKTARQDIVYDGFFKLRKLTLSHRKFDGSWSAELSRELMLRKEAAGVLLYDPQLDAIALVEQFRIGALEQGRSPWLFEIVAGLIERDETAEEVARREAREEADCEITDIEPVLSYFSSPGGTNEYFHLFCGRADLCTAGGIHGLPEEHEDIRVHVVAYEGALQLLAAGALCNAQTIIAIQWLQLNRERLRQQWH